MLMQIVATLGPASAQVETQRALAEVVDRFRLNASHLDAASLERWLEGLAALYWELGRELPVVVDLQGAKMRVGALPTPLELVQGSTVCFVRDQPRDPGHDIGIDAIPVLHPQLYAAIAAGERLWLDDARLEVAVSEVDAEAGEIRAEVLRGGLLRANKGINRPQHPVPCETLSPRDEAMLKVALRYRFCELAFSFVHDGSEAALLPTTVKRIAKIEREEALSHLHAISAAFDELWLCRGDLGSQAGIFRLGELQERFCVEHIAAHPDTPGLLAGQVLEHLTEHREATRSEVVGLHQAERSGFAGIVLSDETAVGRELAAVIAFLRQWRRAGPARV